jgi:hypothetical protein
MKVAHSTINTGMNPMEELAVLIGLIPATAATNWAWYPLLSMPRNRKKCPLAVDQIPNQTSYNVGVR